MSNLESVDRGIFATYMIFFFFGKLLSFRYRTWCQYLPFHHIPVEGLYKN